MRRVDVLIIGGGQAGLAMSACLSSRGIEHVVLERGQVAARWRHERWDSLRLLTPNWMTRLPGHAYDGPDPGGYMAAPDVVRLLTGYAAAARVPVVTGARVVALDRAADGFTVSTESGAWLARQVIIATGHCDVPAVPAAASGAPGYLAQMTPADYRNPHTLPDGGVLVVGGSASGVQLADELLRAGRRVILAVGKHTRMPRVYRGRDIFEWLDALGMLRASSSEVPNLDASRAQPSLQLVGRPTHDTLDLRGLAARGATVTGRFVAFSGATAHFAGDLLASVVASDAKLAALLRRIDGAVDGAPARPARFVPHWPAFMGAVERRIDLRSEGITTVLWATGFRRRYDWLRCLACDARGEVPHHNGETPLPGLFVLGMPFLRHRSSSFIDGVGLDAAHLAGLVSRNLGHHGAAA